jgi:hypothetical protein
MEEEYPDGLSVAKGADVCSALGKRHLVQEE